MDITWRVISRKVEGREWGKGTGNKKHKQEAQNRQGIKNSMGNGEAKEVICMTHGHELRGEGRCRAEGDKGKEK